MSPPCPLLPLLCSRNNAIPCPFAPILRQGWRRINQTFASYSKQTQELQTVLDRNYSSVEEILKWHLQVPEESRKKIEELQASFLPHPMHLPRTYTPI